MCYSISRMLSENLFVDPRVFLNSKKGTPRKSYCLSLIKPIPESHGEERTRSKTVAPPKDVSIMDGACSYFDLPA
jgi:hypothetical protein